jgi:hypothetical protein
MTTITTATVRFAKVISLLIALAIIAGTVQSAAASAAPDPASPATRALVERDSRLNLDLRGPRGGDPGNETGGNGADPALDGECAALEPWATATNNDLNQVRALYEQLEEASQSGPDASFYALDAFGYQLGILVEEMRVADVPAEVQDLHDNLVQRLDDLAWAYTDLVTAALDGDMDLVQAILNDLPKLERELVRAVTDFEHQARTCGFEVGDGGGKRERTRTRTRGTEG